MDPLVIAGLIALIAAGLGFVGTMRGGKTTATLNAGDALRDDLLANAAQAEARITRLEAKVERLENEKDTLDEENYALRKENRNLRDERDEQASHIIVLTTWGMNSTQDPPRSVPHWRERP